MVEISFDDIDEVTGQVVREKAEEIAKDLAKDDKQPVKPGKNLADPDGKLGGSGKKTTDADLKKILGEGAEVSFEDIPEDF